MRLFLYGIPFEARKGIAPHVLALREKLSRSCQPVVEDTRDGDVQISIDESAGWEGDEMFPDFCVIRVRLTGRCGAGLCRGFSIWLINELVWLHAVLPVQTVLAVCVEDDVGEEIVATFGVITDDTIQLRADGA